MYRPEIKVLDCTIRDGGLINKHDFDEAFVREVYRSLSEAGVDYMEIGYKNSPLLFDPKEYGLWKKIVNDAKEQSRNIKPTVIEKPIKLNTLEIGEIEKSGESLRFEDSIGKYDLWELRNRNPKFGKYNRPNLYFPIYISSVELDESGYSKVSIIKQGTFTIEVLPKNSEGDDSCWRWGKEKLVSEDLSSKTAVIVARQKRNGEWNIYQKSRKSSTKAKSIWDETSVISEQGTIQLGELGLSAFFDHPKPLELVKKALQIGTKDSDIILDFFSGSGTTAHAVFDLNKQDGGNRKFIMVQLPEPCAEDSEAFKAGYKTIADIGKERIRRVIKKIQEESKGQLDFQGSKMDLGFKVFKLDQSNFKIWDGAVDETADGKKIEKQLELQIEHSDERHCSYPSATFASGR